MSSMTFESQIPRTELVPKYSEVRELSEMFTPVRTPISYAPKDYTFKVKTITKLSTAYANHEINNIPFSVRLIKYSFLGITLLFLSQFILAFNSTGLINGSVGLVGSVSFLGLYLVANRAAYELKHKGVIS